MSPEHHDEGAEEAIEDLEAPAAMQRDVAGGEGTEHNCIDPTCVNSTQFKSWCEGTTCSATKGACSHATQAYTIWEQ